MFKKPKGDVFKKPKGDVFQKPQGDLFQEQKGDVFKKCLKSQKAMFIGYQALGWLIFSIKPLIAWSFKRYK